MSWLQPSEYEERLLVEVRTSNPEVVQLAQLVSLARKVEPLLLRNLRMWSLPFTETELETQLWFSPLVSARSTRNFVLHHGVARLLAEELRLTETPPLEQVWEFTQQHTQHWSPLDRLEQQLRFYALQNQPEKLQQGIRDVLRKIIRVQDEDQRLDLARWAKKTLPVIAPPFRDMEEITWLAQFAATALGATSEWTSLSHTNTLPHWLVMALPEPFEISQIGVRLHFEPQQYYQVLEFTPIEPDVQALSLPSPLPARIHISCGEINRWHVINTGTLIKLPSVNQRIILTTIGGRQYELLSEFTNTPNDTPQQTIPPPKFYLTFVDEDVAQAKSIAEWLVQHGVQVELIQEIPEENVTGMQDEHTVLLRLWSQATQKRWQTAGINTEQNFVGNLLLRTERAALPVGVNPAQIIELAGWNGDGESEQAKQLLTAIHDWMAGKPREMGTPAEIEGGETYLPEVVSLLKGLGNPERQSYSPDVIALLEELENSDTQPHRRLEIGDQLAGLGDPRPGVGVQEYETEETSYPPEVQELLDKLNNIATQPPYRLQIGNRLAELGDPRSGIGLDKKGMPDIDWVEIPAGDFIYGEGKTRQTLYLDTFYISRYPITNAQYQAFIEAGGYGDKRWWGYLKTSGLNQSRWLQTNRPKERVDFYEAVAFTRWLSAQCGYEIHLPTEQQWEKAACGTDGRQYPWGNKYLSGYANVNEKVSKTGKWYLEESTAVGMYPQGASPFGVMDMSGNVWEWCLNKYEKPEQTEVDTSSSALMLRGGSWFDDPKNTRVTSYFKSVPHGRYLYWGFRVACILPLVTR